MNSDLLKAIEELNEYLNSLELVKEFKYYEKLVKNNPELYALEERLKQLQKDIVNDKHIGECDDLISEYQVLKEQFENHPYVYNYLSLKQEVNDLIQDISYSIMIQLESNVKN